MITVKYLKTLDDVKDLLFEQERNEEIGRLRSNYYYRGMPNASFDLSTSLMRNCGKKAEFLEKPILDYFIKYVSIEDPTIAESIWKAMIVGQHHGLPTRLLDWSRSTLVALHFATTENNLEKLDKRDGVVWRVDSSELNSKLPAKYQDVLTRENTKIFSVDLLSSVVDNIKEYDEDMGKKSMVTIEPHSIDQRIVNQYAFFSIIPSGIKNIEKYLDDNTEHTVKYVIDKSIRWDLRDILDQMNMNERMIYPGTDGIAKWVARHFYVKK